MSECLKKYFLLNNKRKECGEFSHYDIYSGRSAYEVIRLVKGEPLFFEDHMDRLRHTLETLESNSFIYFSNDTLLSTIEELAVINHVSEGNVKLVYNFPPEAEPRFLAFFIEHHYPTQEQYHDGVPSILYFAERDFPSAKIINMSLRSAIFKKLLDSGVHEALLVDKQGYITEGSRSNVFLVSGDQIYTAPDGTVLPGIARKYVLSICREKGLKVSFERIRHDDIDKFDAAFITGTSPGVLALASVGDHLLDPDNALVKMLMKEYHLLAEKYINAKFRDSL